MKKSISCILAIVLAAMLITACAQVGQSMTIITDNESVVSSIATKSMAGAESITSNNSTLSYALPNSDDAEYTYKSDLIGWVTLRWHNSLEPNLYETTNGGKTWSRSNIVLQPEMLDGVVSVYTWPVKNVNGKWSLSLFIKKNYGYPSNNFYDFILDENSNTWLWDAPLWTLSKEINQLNFIDYVASQTSFNPLSYDAQQGLTTIYSIHKMIYDAAFYEKRIGNELPNKLIPFEKVNEFAIYQYGDAEFDVRSFLPELDGRIRYDKKGFYILSDGPEAFTEGIETFVCEGKMLEKSQIEVYTITVYYGGGGNAGQNTPLYRKSIYAPIEFNGLPLYTLHSSELLDFSEFSGSIPISHWAE